MKMGLMGMAKARWVFYREISSFFGANLPPITIGLVAFLSGLISVLLSKTGTTYDDVTRSLFYFFYLLIILAALILSMGSFVNERKQGTMELLYTLPVTDLELVLGKFLMGVTVLSVLAISLTIVYVILIASGPLYLAAGGCIGIILVGLYAYSIGIFASTLSDNHIMALLISFVIVLLIDITGYLSGLFPSPAREILAHIHAVNLYQPFTNGIISLRSVIFFMSTTFFFLFLSVRVLESRRWRGQTGS